MVNKTNANYEHYYNKAKLNENFPDEKEFILVDNVSKLEKILKEDESEYMACDTETSDLDPEQGEMVGYSFSFDSETGYYIPLRHKVGENIDDVQVALDLLVQKLKDIEKSFWYNVRFDFRFLEFEGYDMRDVGYYDVTIGTWFADTNIKQPSLKWACRFFLGWDMQTFEETLGDVENFQFVDPMDAVEYAGADAIGTYALSQKTLKFFKEGSPASKIDNKTLYPIMKFEDHPLPIDYKYLKGMLYDVEKEIKEIERDIYSEVGYEFNIDSPKQVAEVLEDMGLHTGEYTDTGYMKTGKSLLEDLGEPIGDKIVKYKELSKLKGTYIETLAESAEENDGELRFAYKTSVVPCLTNRAMVDIKDEGLISIKNVEERDEILTIQGWKKVLWKNKKWADDVYRVILKNGRTLEGTGHHPVLVNDINWSGNGKINTKWVGIEDLEEGDYVVLNGYVNENERFVDIEDNLKKVGRKEIDIPEKINEELAQLIGFIDGDGDISRRDCVRLCFNSEEDYLMDYYGDLMKRIFDIDYTVEDNSKDDSTIRYNYFSVDLVKFLGGLGLRENSVPEVIKKSGYSVRCAYLAGYWDSDGTYLKGGKEENIKYVPRVKSKDEGRLRDVSNILSSLGMNNIFKERVTDDRGKNRWEVEVRYDTREKFRWRVVNKYMKHKEKIRRANKNKYSDRDYSKERLLYSQVDKVEKVKSQYVYDIEVEDIHHFIANGIVTHNTGRLACGGDRKNDYFCDINLQSIPKPSSEMWYVHEADEKHSEDENVIMGYRFSTEDKSDKMAEGFEKELNIRRAFVPENDDYYWVSVDFSSQMGTL